MAGLTWSALNFSSITLVRREEQIDAECQGRGEAVNRREKVTGPYRREKVVV